MIRRPPTRIELRPEDKEEVSARREPSSRANPPRPPEPSSREPSSPPIHRKNKGTRRDLTRPPPSRSPSTQYEEARKAHIRKLQADLARGSTENLVQNSFQFNPDGKDDKSKEERIGLGK
jgi:hypothetical protein